ncbi:MAG: S8 family serine peptidase [Geobacteraceae bacterium]|nr:S8 family serine peptidase [Geobacteraceae bacterium]
MDHAGRGATIRIRTVPEMASSLVRIAAAAMLVLLFCGGAWGQPAAEKGMGKVATPGGHDALLARIGKSGKVRLIVRVDADFQPVADPASEAAQRQTGRIATAQDSLLASLAGVNPKGVHRYRHVPYLLLEADDRALPALLASPLVRAVYEDLPLVPQLDLSVPRIGAPVLWNWGLTGAGVTVAVLDTGVDKNHPFLSGSVVAEACYSMNDAAENVSSLCPGGVTESVAAGAALPYGGNCPAGECDHGTHVAGIIAGRADVAGSPGPGVAPEASLIAIQVFARFDDKADCDPESSPCVRSYTSLLLKGMERVYALRTTHNIAAVNASLGFGQYPGNCDEDFAPSKAIVDTLKAAGIATIVSSGNDGYCGSMGAPACLSSAVSVGATTDGDAVAGYSNSASFMSLLAPGSVISSSVPGGGYASWSGTSMAAPHVAGAWALLKQAMPAAGVDQILGGFTATGLTVTDGECPEVTKKRINVPEALNALGDAAPPAVTATFPASGATGVAVSSPVRVTFSEAMDADTISAATFTLSNGVTGTVSYDPATFTATFTPAANLALATVYQASVTTGVTDAAGNPLAQNKSWSFATVPAQQNLTVTIAGSGSGGVASSPAGIACTTGICQAGFGHGSTVTLTASPSGDSLFSGWSGACSNPSGVCTVTMNGAMVVAATFAPLPSVRLAGPAPLYFPSLQAVYNAAADGSAIQARGVVLVENSVLDRPVAVTLAGGYDGSYASATGFTSLEGSLTIRSGSLTVDRLAVR